MHFSLEMISDKREEFIKLGGFGFVRYRRFGQVVPLLLPLRFLHFFYRANVYHRLYK